MKLRRPEMRRARIEIIPMIDTIFFLLVFFMISSLSMVKMKAMPTSLPKNVAQGHVAGAQKSVSGNDDTVIVTVNDAGRYFVGKQAISADDLSDTIQSKVAAQPKSVVVLNLSKGQTTQTLIDIMDKVNRIKTPTGQSVPALIATEPVDINGHAVAAPLGLAQDNNHVP